MIGLSYGNLASSSVQGYDADAQAIIDQMTANGSTPSKARQSLINQLVLDLKGDGNTGSSDIWSKLDILNIHAAEDAIQAQTEWINADGTYDAVQINSPTFTTDVGFSSTTDINRIDPVWNTATALGNYTQNNASMGFYGDVEINRYFLGDTGVNYIRFRGANGLQVDTAFNGSSVGTSVDWGSVSGLFILDRTVSTEFKAYTNTSEVATVSSTSGALVADQILYPYALASGGNQTCKIFFAGASIRSDLTQLKNSFDAYLNAL